MYLGVGPENAYPQLTNQHRQNQGDTKGEVVPLRIDEANKAEKHSDIQKPFILNIGNVSNSGPNTNDTKPVISDKVITSTDINIAAVVNNGSAVPEKPAWDGTSSATVSQEDMDSGALFRLFLVLSGLCAFSIVYVGYRFYR